jgi:hypothetical protein
MSEIVCDKIPYKKYSDGISEMVGLSKRRKQKFKLYKCPTCKNFHIATLSTGKAYLAPTKNTKYPKIETEVKLISKKIKNTFVPHKYKEKSVAYATYKVLTKEQSDILKKKIQ